MISRNQLILIKRIASRVNPRIKQWASLSDKKGRLAETMTLAEGARLVFEALDPTLNPQPRRLTPTSFIISDSGAEHPDAGKIFTLAEQTGVERFSVSDDCFNKISGLKNSDGLAVTLSFNAEEEALKNISEKKKMLVADGVQDPGNAGALARTALAAGCDACLFLEGADPLSPKFLRGSMGAVFRLPCFQLAKEDFINAAATTEMHLLVATSEAGATSYRNAKYNEPVAVVVGGEKGISQEMLGLKAERIHIPLHGNVESLNLAVAAGVVLFEAEKHWNA